MIISKKISLRLVFLGSMLIFIISTVSADNSLKVMLYGDSLMAGYGLPQNENLTSELTRNFKENNPSLTFINASISGNTSKNGLSRVDWSLGDKPNIVILCLGANDMLRGLDPALTANNLNTIITKFKKNNAIVILAGMLSPESMGPDYQSEFDSIYPELSKKHSLIFMPFLLDGVALEKDLLLADYKHPNVYKFSNNSYRIAYRNIVAKKSLAPIMTISLGIGLTLLLTLSFVANNLKKEISDSIPSMAPDLFFVGIDRDIQSNLESFIKGVDPNVELEFSPMASASFISLNGIPIEEVVSESNRSAWVVEGDRRISWSEKPKPDNPIIEGEWWEIGNENEMFISMDSRAAYDLGMKINDKITLNILGRDVTGVVKNFREVDYRDISINFAIIINKAFANKLPYEYVGTLKSELSSSDILAKVVEKFPNVSAIKIDRILSQVSDVLNKVFIAVTAISLIVIVIGLIVIVSAVLVQTTFRRYNNLIYKILGVDFPTILKAMTMEFAVIYGTLIFFALTVAVISSYLVVENTLQLSWQFDLGLTLWILVSTALVSFILILLANRSIFSPKVYPLIRNE